MDFKVAGCELKAAMDSHAAKEAEAVLALAQILWAWALLAVGSVPSIDDGRGPSMLHKQLLLRSSLFFLEAWRAVDRAYVDKSFNGQSWFKMREEYVKKEPMKNKAETYGTIPASTSSLQQQPATTSNHQVVAPAPGGPAEMAGVKAGDYITGVDGTPTAGLSLYEASDLLLGEVGTEAQTPAGIVIDLRNNGGGYFPAGVEMARSLIASGDIVLIADSDGIRDIYSADTSTLDAKIPIAVLVNKGTASASEVMAGALKDSRGSNTTIVGTNTFGKGLIQTIVNLSDGSGVAVTVARYQTPLGIDINKIGISPDITADLDVLPLVSAPDVMCKALQAPTAPRLFK
eukprot:gene25284-10937_t